MDRARVAVQLSQSILDYHMEVCDPNTVDSYSSGEYIGLPANEIWRLCLPGLGKWHGVAGVHGQCGLHPLGHALEGGHDGALEDHQQG